ncbi:helix-turn-helix domain-containing protein [Providencia hangzhouensis]|uniref:helix-turn-helix domain-containing protein n=1 Tax=Providencia hangzhouensis TaxID=3031799 RepID=UPI0034DD6460
MNSTNSISSRVGLELKQLRVKAGLTAFELAKMSGIKSEQQLYRYEKGSNKITIGDLVAALRVLNVNIGSFFDKLDLGELNSIPDEGEKGKISNICIAAQTVYDPFSEDDEKAS